METTLSKFSNVVVIRERETEEGLNSTPEPAMSGDAPVLTAKVGKNSAVFPGMMGLYVPEGSVVADLTFGRGAFWKDVRQGAYSILASDTEDRRGKSYRRCRADFTFIMANMQALPYRAESLDVVIMDPPYSQLSTRPQKNDSFSFSGAYNLETNRGGDGVKALYRTGILEAHRVLRPEGLAVVKCQDFVNGGRQNWLHVDLFSWAVEAGFAADDLFVLVQDQRPMMRHDYQLHARKNHSYFWVFRKTNRKSPVARVCRDAGARV